MLLACSMAGYQARTAAEAQTAAGQQAPPPRGALDAAVPARPVEDGRGLLNALGVSDAMLDGPGDDAPPTEEDLGAIAAMLNAARRASPLELDRLVKSAPADAPSPEAWSGLGGSLFAISGRAKRITKVDLPPELASRFVDLPSVVRCEVEMSPGDRPAVAYALAAPRAWKADSPLDEPVQIQGFLARLTPGEGNAAWRPVFVAKRIGWLPDTRLGKLGMDMGLFDLVRAHTRLDRREADCFYRLLAAAGRSAPGELLQGSGGKPDNLLPLLTDARRHAGELVSYIGTANRVLLVRVEPELAERFGFDHYFQIEMDVVLEQPVKWQGAAFRRFPTIVCVRELPPDMPVGENIHVNVRIAGFFYALWDYRSGAVDDAKAGADQFAPLIVGRDVAWLQAESQRDSLSAYVAGGIFVLAVAAGWLVVWRAQKGDRKFREEVLAKRRAVEIEVPPRIEE